MFVLDCGVGVGCFWLGGLWFDMGFGLRWVSGGIGRLVLFGFCCLGGCLWLGVGGFCVGLLVVAVGW